MEIKRIERHHSTHTVRASPKNEGFREIIPAVPRVPSIAEKMVPPNERIYNHRRGSSSHAVQQNAQICRETGKEHMVKVHSGEGVANHPGPEPCGGLREGTDEKSVGGHVGGVLRRESC